MKADDTQALVDTLLGELELEAVMLEMWAEDAERARWTLGMEMLRERALALWAVTGRARQTVRQGTVTP